MQQTHKSDRWRLYALATLVITLWVVAFGRLFYVQAMKGSDYARQATLQQSRKFEIPATRGLIYVKESSGLQPIALNTQVYTLAADPKFVQDPSSVAEKISSITAQSDDDIKAKLTKSGRYSEISKSVRAGREE